MNLFDTEQYFTNDDFEEQTDLDQMWAEELKELHWRERDIAEILCTIRQEEAWKDIMPDSIKKMLEYRYDRILDSWSWELEEHINESKTAVAHYLYEEGAKQQKRIKRAIKKSMEFTYSVQKRYCQSVSENLEHGNIEQLKTDLVDTLNSIDASSIDYEADLIKEEQEQALFFGCGTKEQEQMAELTEPENRYKFACKVIADTVKPILEEIRLNKKYTEDQISEINTILTMKVNSLGYEKPAYIKKQKHYIKPFIQRGKPRGVPKYEEAEYDEFMPHSAVITHKGYEDTTNFAPARKDRYTSLYPNVVNTSALTFENGVLQMPGDNDVALQNFITNEPIEAINTDILNGFLALLLNKYEIKLKYMSTNEKKEYCAKTKYTMLRINIRNLARNLGYQAGFNKETEKRLLEEIKVYDNIIGIQKTASSYSIPSYRKVVSIVEYDGEKGILYTLCPHIESGLKSMLLSNIEREEQNKPSKALISYNVKASIGKRNANSAVQNIASSCAKKIVTIIEQSGSRTPHFSFKYLLDENMAFQRALKKATNPYRFLNDVVKVTFTKLKDDTTLTDAYKNIKLPQATPENSISLRTMDRVFEIKHDGKIKK